MLEWVTALQWYDWIGILGSLSLCGGFLAVSNQWLAADRAAFQWVNLGGASLLLVSLCFRPNYGAILIELAWILIAVVSLIRIQWRARAADSSDGPVGQGHR